MLLLGILLVLLSIACAKYLGHPNHYRFPSSFFSFIRTSASRRLSRVHESGLEEASTTSNGSAPVAEMQQAKGVTTRAANKMSRGLREGVPPQSSQRKSKTKRRTKVAPAQQAPELSSKSEDEFELTIVPLPVRVPVPTSSADRLGQAVDQLTPIVAEHDELSKKFSRTNAFVPRLMASSSSEGALGEEREREVASPLLRGDEAASRRGLRVQWHPNICEFISYEPHEDDDDASTSDAIAGSNQSRSRKSSRVLRKPPPPYRGRRRGLASSISSACERMTRYNTVPCADENGEIWID